MEEKEYIGSGISWPLTINGGKTGIVSGVDKVLQSILRILTTPKGKIIFNPEYGSRIHELQFIQNDDILKNLLTLFVDEAISEWEKRCKFVGIDFEVNEEVIKSKVSVRILNRNEIESFVFPFYKELKN